MVPAATPPIFEAICGGALKTGAGLRVELLEFLQKLRLRLPTLNVPQKIYSKTILQKLSTKLVVIIQISKIS